jgi:sporulation protein YlmC with PRC-barrel domain
MTQVFALRTLLTGVAAGALMCLVNAGGATAQSSAPQAAGSTSTMTVVDSEQRALDAIAQARKAAQQHKIRSAIDQVESAEVALLNVSAMQPDPHIKAALDQLDAARDAISRKDIATADQQLALASGVVAVAANTAASSAGSSTPPQAGNMPASAGMTADQARQMVGQQVYDNANVDIGPIVDIVLDDDGTPASIIIAVAGPPDGGASSVAVPMTSVQKNGNRMSTNRSKDQLRKAASYRAPGSPTSGSGNSNSQNR